MDHNRRKRYLINPALNIQTISEYLHVNCADFDKERALQEYLVKRENLKPTAEASLQSYEDSDISVKMKMPSAKQAEWSHAIVSNPIFRKTFPNGGYVALVDIDNVISPQLDIDLDHISMMSKKSVLKGAALSKKIFDLTLNPQNNHQDFNRLEQIGTGGALQIFSSRNQDFRYLGSFSKK